MSGDRLFHLLPAVHRLRDAPLGSPLRALLGVMEEQFDVVAADLEDLYESWFVETAPEWVLPYIGELVGNRPLVEVTHSRRTDVARTLYYRRRKGTLPMLEELARDVTGWGAHAVELMELLAWTQHLNHLRYSPSPNPGFAHPHAFDRVGTINVRNGDALDRLDGAWDMAAHTVDVRRAPPGAYRPGVKNAARNQEGWYGTRKVGFFLWRLQSFPLTDSPARPADPPNQHGWHIHPLGAPIRLFVNPRADRDPARLAGEVHVPAPMRRVAFREDLEAYRAKYLPLPPDERPANSEWYGPDRSLLLIKDGRFLLPEEIVCRDLAGWERPPAGLTAVDVVRGRVTFAAGEEAEDLSADFAYGFSAPIGGGPYDRRVSLAAHEDAVRAHRNGVDPWVQPVAKGTPVETLQQALTAWNDAGQPPGIIRIEDNGVYGGAVAIVLPDDGWLVIEAAQGKLPSVRLVGDMSVSAPPIGARLSFDGLLIEGAVALDGPVTLEIDHCTLVPGRMLTDEGLPWFPDRDSIVVATGGTQTPEVTIRASITGAIRLPSTTRHLTLRDCIVQAFEAGGVLRPAIAATDPADAPGPPATLERTTVFGEVHVRELTLASEVIFTAPVLAQRRQAGCVRFSYVPPGSRTPRRFHCQPDLALQDVTDAAEAARVASRLVPAFSSERYGRPEYAQLRLDSALEIRTGAENGSEMGAFSSLMQPQREANLRTRLDEYLPFGLEAGLIHVT